MNNNKLKATIFRIVRLNKILEIDLRPIFQRVRLMVTNTRKVQTAGDKFPVVVFQPHSVEFLQKKNSKLERKQLENIFGEKWNSCV